jgi:hypothetical protein
MVRLPARPPHNRLGVLRQNLQAAIHESACSIFGSSQVWSLISSPLRPILTPISPGRGLALPQGVSIPPAVQNALQNGGSPRRSTSKRESMQRNTKWWLPYVILEFDRSQMLVEAIDGDLANPVYNYRTPLSVLDVAEVHLLIQLLQ